MAQDEDVERGREIVYRQNAGLWAPRRALVPLPGMIPVCGYRVPTPESAVVGSYSLLDRILEPPTGTLLLVVHVCYMYMY